MAKPKRRWLTAWVPLRLELLVSPAWKARPAPVAKIIERLFEEHLRHGGLNNGQLFVAYSQFVNEGVSRRSVRAALDCAVALGLIEVTQDEEGRGDIRAPNQYRLTFLPCGKANPTDEWRLVTPERAQSAVAAFRKANNDNRKDSAVKLEVVGNG